MIQSITLLYCALFIFSVVGCGTPASYQLADTRQGAGIVETDQEPPANPASPSPSRARGESQGETEDPVDPSNAFRPQIVYTGELTIRVDRVVHAQAQAEAVVTTYRGYISESRSGYLVIRVPAEHFDEALAELAGLGEVTRKDVRALDVTDRIVDLESRLRSARAMRERLLELIDRADNMEHALQIERELARVVEQIEIIEGRLRLAKQQVTFSTITMTIAPTPAEQRLRPEIPVVWVRDIGGAIRERNRIDVTTPRRLRDGVNVDLPEGFVRYYQEGYVTQAINAEGVRIRVRRMKNFDEEGPLAFWAQLIERSLRENAGLTIESHDTIKLYNDRQGKLIQASTMIAGEAVRYYAAVSVSNRYVYVYEVWGVAESVDRDLDPINASIRSMRAYETLLD
ncbi:MAG: DUF4349 domain-containing protein [Planctomycetota bacterium]